MPLRQTPNINIRADSMLRIETPGAGGLNLKDLEYEQSPDQSPYMINMMYRNGAFSKRYGQRYYSTYNDTIYAAAVYRNEIYIHSGTKIYKENTQIASSLPEKKGLFAVFNQLLYYFCDSIYSYDGTTWKEVEPYIPTVVINRKPDGTSGDTMEPYNMVGTGFQNIFHGDGTSTVFLLTDKDLDRIQPSVKVDDEDWTYDESLGSAKTFKVDYTAGTVTLVSAPLEGTNNVEITAYKHDAEWDDYHSQIVNSKYYSCFGGNNNSRLFLAGGGKSTYYYSEVYDASYFPYINYAKVGNSADDITGFGQQYNVLLIFKPTEIYSLTYYQQTSSTTTDESQIGLGAFRSQVVNSSIGCDCPNTIQLINNQLTWLSTREGVCCLVSTSIIDERNVRPISRNINRQNNFGVSGILDWTDREEVVSVDWDGRYFLANKTTGECFMWDYSSRPYYLSSGKTASEKALGWFLFNNFYVSCFIKNGNNLFYVPSQSSRNDQNKVVIVDNSFNDFGEAIESKYVTPFFDFGYAEYLKTVKNLFIQCRGDTNTLVNLSYYTDEIASPEADPDPIEIFGNGVMWKNYAWANFRWSMNSWAKVFRRKCNLKKIQLAAFCFENSEIDKDMSIAHVGIQYQVIKNVR